MKFRKSIAYFITIALILSVFLQPLNVYSYQGGSGRSGTDDSGNGQYGSGGTGGSGSGSGGSGGTGGSGDHETEDGITHEGTGGTGSGGTGGSGSGGSGSGGAGGSGGSGSGRGGTGGGKPTVTNGAVVLDVTVKWPVGLDIPVHPNEVEITLIGADSSDTVLTNGGTATFHTEPGDEWKVVGEAIPGYIIPEENVAIKGTVEFVEVTLIYEVGFTEVTNIELNKSTLTIFQGDSVQLSAKVLPANAIQGVIWSSSNNAIVKVADGVVTGITVGEAIITARSGSSIATCTVTVKSTENVIRVSEVFLNIDSTTLTLGVDDGYQLIATISPEEAIVTDVLWTSRNPEVATVDENGWVTAVSAGATLITVETVDGGKVDYAYVTVVLQAEIELIYPTLAGGVLTEHFEDAQEVYINVENLVAKLISDDELGINRITYYVKVMEKGDTDPLNTIPVENSTVIINSVTKEFSLAEVTKFIDTLNYSSRYYVYMSQFDDFPKDDEKTLMTNFMGGTSTPTIPPENVDVRLEFADEHNREGIVFVLTREEIADETLGVAGVTWRDFYITGKSNSPVNPYAEDGEEIGEQSFVDEVKMVGKTNGDGLVVWFTPRETLKIGGYFLLEVTPLGYNDNLSEINPASDDGELRKEVHLMRDGFIDIDVLNWPVNGNTSIENQAVIDVSLQDPVFSESINPTYFSTLSTLSTTEDKLVTMSDVEKITGHWAKKLIDNIIQKGMLKKSVFNVDVDLNEKISHGNVIGFIQSITMKEQEKEELDIDSNNPVTREEAAVLVMKAFEFEPLEDAVLTFVDSDEIDVVTKGYIAKAAEIGVITGYPDNTYRPKATITSAELLTMISRCLDIKS